MHRERLSRIAGYALNRPEAYAIVGLVFVAVVIAILGGWPGWVIAASVAAGALLLGLLVLDSLADPRAERGAALADLEPGRIHDRTLRQKLLRAMEYVRAVQELAGRGAALDPAGEELPQLEESARGIYQMALRLQEFRADRLVQRDLADLQAQERRGRLSGDQAEQLKALRHLDGLVRAAEQAVDGALADLGRAYAEMQSIRATPELRGRASEALDQLDASARRLSELAAGYDEAFGTRGARRQG